MENGEGLALAHVRGLFLKIEFGSKASRGRSEIASWAVLEAVLDGVHVGPAAAVGETGISCKPGERSRAPNFALSHYASGAYRRLYLPAFATMSSTTMATPANSGNSPLASLCASCHSRDKQLESRHGYVPGADANGEPTDPRHPWFK